MIADHSKNPNLVGKVGLLPRPDINPQFGGQFEPGPWFDFTAPEPFTEIMYLSSDHNRT
jgi:hypothetical protein